MSKVITTNACVNIFGGNNMILPNVTQVGQPNAAAEVFAAACKKVNVPLICLFFNQFLPNIAKYLSKMLHN